MVVVMVATTRMSSRPCKNTKPCNRVTAKAKRCHCPDYNGTAHFVVGLYSVSIKFLFFVSVSILSIMPSIPLGYLLYQLQDRWATGAGLEDELAGQYQLWEIPSLRLAMQGLFPIAQPISRHDYPNEDALEDAVYRARALAFTLGQRAANKRAKILREIRQHLEDDIAVAAVAASKRKQAKKTKKVKKAKSTKPRKASRAAT